jgi:peptidoglycan/LPS O-acetylase OafA/YrhL
MFALVILMNSLLRRLRRVTLTTNYMPEIDGLRFVAILAVVVLHLSEDLVDRHGLSVGTRSQWLFNLIEHGTRGVQLFFAISGFILALPFVKGYRSGQSAPSLKKYFRRRLLRLEPPFLLNVMVCAVATWAMTPAMRPFVLPHTLAALTYSNGLIYHYHNPVNVVWWSLEVETQFYLAMPLLATVFLIRSAALRRGLLAVLALTAFLWQSGSPSWVVGSTLLGSIQYFLIGLLLADLSYSADLRLRNRYAWDIAGSLALAAVFLLPSGWPIAAPVLLFLAVAGAMYGRVFRELLSLPWVCAIGGMCYTIYLWHMFIMAFVLKMTVHALLRHNYALGLATQVLVIVPAILFTSVLLFLMVEKPCMEPEWPSMLRQYLAGQLVEESLVEAEGLTEAA